MSTLTGQLLIAMPAMADPRFAKSVVYLCAHSDEGAMGLIVNKPTPELRFAELLEQLDIAASAPPPMEVCFGGPVEPGRGFVLHSDDYAAGEGTVEVDQGISMTATLEILQQIAAGTGPRAALLALGYAGWGAGQLEQELAENAWLTAPATPDLVFGAGGAQKWTEALRSIGVDPLMLSETSGRA